MNPRIFNNTTELAQAMQPNKPTNPDGFKLLFSDKNEFPQLLALLIDTNCPQNLRVSFQGELSQNEIDELAAVIETGLCARGLTISTTGELDDEGMTRLASVLASGKCPRNFGLKFQPKVSQEHEFVTESIPNPAYPDFPGMTSRLTYLKSPGIDAIIDALHSGNCPTGLRLNMGNSRFKALIDALQDPRCPVNLEFISGIYNDDYVAILNSGNCSSGLSIRVTPACEDPFNFSSLLMRALTNNKFPSNFKHIVTNHDLDLSSRLDYRNDFSQLCKLLIKLEDLRGFTLDFSKVSSIASWILEKLLEVLENDKVKNCTVNFGSTSLPPKINRRIAVLIQSGNFNNTIVPAMDVQLYQGYAVTIQNKNPQTNVLNIQDLPKDAIRNIYSFLGVSPKTSIKNEDIISTRLQQPLPQNIQPAQGAQASQFLGMPISVSLNVVDDFCETLNDDKYDDSNEIVKFIFAQDDNKILDELHAKLQESQFDYLREHNWFSRYYGMFNHERKQTSHSWVRIERALSLQMTQNELSNPTSDDFFDKHDFIKNNRKYRFHFSWSRTYQCSEDYGTQEALNLLQEKKEVLKTQMKL